ncbi:MAG TPA: sensor histidine kinase [Candidatus Aminicenantes bacterium]|nr:sensor histidine kinase [Candidatus Aminicenantes bacterium]
MILINIKEWKLRHKIILHVVIIGILTAILLTFLYIKTQRNIIHTMSRQKAELVGSMIESSIFSAMKDGKLENVQTALQEIATPSDIKKIRIISPQGKILRSSEEDEIGSTVESSTLDKMNEFLSKKNLSDIIFIRPKSTIQGFHIIENRNECFNCHSPSKKINGILEVNIDYAATVALLQKNQLKGVIIALVSLVILNFVILRLFEKIINRPIFQLKDKMKKVQEGDLNIQLSSLKNDEIGSLTQSFAIMVRKLKEANHKIEELFNKQMEKAEHLASIGELAAGLAHEIRNPIAGMKGALEIINEKTDEKDIRKEIFTEILLQIEKINNIIQDLLSYAKPKEMSVNLVDPNECVKNAMKLAAPQISDKDIHFRFKGLENGTPAYIDADKIQEVILNLMLNSISAINKKGHITIDLRERNKRGLEIILSDNGKGIKKEILSQIFNPFFTTKKRGTGLGLSICKKIIMAHKGSIEVKSQERKGTTFTIRLPVFQSEG